MKGLGDRIKWTFVGLFLLLFACNENEREDLNHLSPQTGDAIKVFVNSYNQSMHHFGASDAWSAEWVGRWPDASKEPIAKLLFSSAIDSEGNPEGIALSMWRFNIAEGAGDQANSGYAANAWKRETGCFLSPDGSYDWSKQPGSRWFLQKAKAYGVPYFTGWTNSPPYFMTKNGYTFRTAGVSGYNLAREHYRDFAVHLATVTKHFQDKGYNFVAISPFNEPQHAWTYTVGEAPQPGSYATNTEIASVTRIVDEEFSELGVNSKIMLPEAGSLAALYRADDDPATSDQLYRFYDPTSSDYIGDLSNLSHNVAGHSYWLNPDVSTSITHRQNLLTKMRQTDARLEYWQTEYSLLGADYRDGRQWTDLEGMDYALWMARIIHTDITQANASGWSFWTALNNSTWQDHPQRFNLILWSPNVDGPAQSDGSYVVTKNLWTLGNFSRFVRPGMVRINIHDERYPTPEKAAANFMISGYRNLETNELVLVMINYTENERDLVIDNYLDFELVNDAFDAYTTSATKNLEHSKMTVNDISIPGRSVTTLVGQIK